MDSNNTYRILAHGRTISNDTWITGLNNNDLIIGPSGAGKTRGYVKPNILQCSGSMVVADTKGALCSDVGPVLAQQGYKVMEINFADCALSPYGYNPLAYIRQDCNAALYSRRKKHFIFDSINIITALSLR